MASRCKDNGMRKSKFLAKAVSKKHDFIEFKMSIQLKKDFINLSDKLLTWFFFVIKNF